MATVHRHSFTRLTASQQTDEQFCLNVVFVHGLRGHPQKTWETAAVSTEVTKKSRGLSSLFKRRAGPSLAAEQAQDPSSSSTPSPAVFWPKEYLAVDIPQACVWTYGYNADVIGGLFQANNKNSISQHGRDLSVRLEREIDNGKPLAFVVHSLGGIVLKDAIRRSEVVRSRTKLVVFLGTPHRGSAYADWGQIASKLACLALQDSNKKILETLEVNNEILDNIHEEFKTIASTGSMKIHTFQEAQGITGMKGVSAKVVDDFSSKLDLPQSLETVESIDANHMQMAKYSSRDDQGYRAISGVLKAQVRRELERQQALPAATVDATSAPLNDVLFMVPFARDDLFVGREKVLAQISERKAAAPTHTRVALVGLGGVGKSQIAIEYAYRMQAAEPHVLVFWIHASSPTRFRQGYRSVADKLLLPGREDAKANVLQLVCDWLSDRRNGQWLMVLDNVDDDNIFFGEDPDSRPLESFLPQTAYGTILITSRNKVAATNLIGTHGNVVEVEPMGEEDALTLLHTRVPFGSSSREDAKALVHTLERIPLAITHAAAYIKTRASTMTLSTYLELFRESEANQMHLLSSQEWKDIRRDYSIRNAVITTWQISFDHIRKMERSAADLLALMSMFDKQGIPRWLLQQTNTSQLDFNDALAPLLSFSLVKTEIGSQFLSMHRLVQLSMRRWLHAEKELDRWVKQSIQALNAVFPSGKYGTWERCKVLLPHMKEILSHRTEDKKGLEEQAKGARRTGVYLTENGEYTAAEGLFRLSLDINEKVFGREHPYTLGSVNNLGLVLGRQGRYDEAEAMHRRDLEGSEKALGLEHLDTLTSLDNLGIVLERQGQYDEAEAMHQRALEGKEKALGLEHLDTLTSLDNLGIVLERQGRYDEAEAMHRRALEGIEKVLGPEHIGTLKSVNNLGIVLERQGRYNEAEAMHRRDLEGSEKALGLEHLDTLTSLDNLGIVLERQGRYDEAEAMHRRALEGIEKVLGPEHIGTLKSVNNLGIVLERQGRYNEAEAMHRRALEGKEKALGREHITTLNSVYNMAFIFHRKQHYSTAVELYQRAYEGFVKVLDEQHPNTLQCLRHYESALREEEV